MSCLTRPERYDIKDSNIALLGSDLEKRVREHAGDSEPAWLSAGRVPGLQIWRVEKFELKVWPSERYGEFYDGDSYIVLHTYKVSDDSEQLAYDVHFWLGEETSQDEAGTAAYKTVELDDHLQGLPTQYREVQNYESARFMSYFPRRFHSLHGGVATGFHHVQAPPPDAVRKLYRVHGHIVREVQNVQANSADVYVLDEGSKISQLNFGGSAGRERFEAGQFVRGLQDAREGKCEIVVLDEGEEGPSTLLSRLSLHLAHPPPRLTSTEPHLFLLTPTRPPSFTPFPLDPTSLTSSPASLVLINSPVQGMLYVWVSKNAPKEERRHALVYAQAFLHAEAESAEGGAVGGVSRGVVRVDQGREGATFWAVFQEGGKEDNN